VGEFFAGAELALTPAERGVLSKLVPTAPEVVRPKAAVPAELAVKLVLFHSESCSACARVKVMLKDFLEEHPDTEIQYRELDEGENFELHYALCTALGVPVEDEGTVPALFSAERFMIAGDITPESIAELAQSAVGLPAPWEAHSTAGEAIDGVVREKFEALTIPAVIGGGLIDGINPCAFAVIIFFITYMKFAGKTKRQMFQAGLLYTVAVFVTYLGIGLGLYGLLGLTGRVAAGQIVVTALTAVFVLMACILCVVDGFRCLGGRTDKVVLKLPDSFKSRIHHLMTARTRAGLTVVGVLTLGFLVALFEFPCTGQLYLPIVIILREWTGASLFAFAWLMLYNVCFILPLVVVFIALLAGLTSERLIAVYQRHLATVKFAMAAVFAGLFVLLVGITPVLKGFLYRLFV
ncbi:MAG: hypothetical protein QGH74_07560, partial [Candidatus Brocadiia bacterium]|nr:hypothetical protein [Candidatus Brocadiia bacterium]